jgi:chemotaxis-related protein WspB
MTGSATVTDSSVTAGDTMHVVARVGTERFAFRVADVEEVLDAPALIAVPDAPSGLAGQLLHRDQTVRAYDGAWVFGIPRVGRAGTALVLRVAADRVAILVDDVEDLAALDADAIRTPPAGTDPAGLLRGVCLPGTTGAAARDGALIGVVNAAAMMARTSSLRGAPARAGGSP